MKNIIFILVVIIIGFLIYSFFGPFGFKSPKNYDECVTAGGSTNTGEMRTQNSCQYNGKTFLGPIF